MTDALFAGPIQGYHERAGATFAAFGGWNMPVSYSGTVAEHTAVRERVGVFDVSHLGKVDVAGPGAAGFVNRCLTNDLGKIAPGKAQYSLCCNESGGVIDDLIAYLVSPNEVFLVPNASNTAAVVDALKSASPEDITIADRHRDFAVFAVQGPRSPEVLAAMGLPNDMGYMSFADSDYAGTPVRVCRTGYTGEHGYELIVGWADSEPVFAEIDRRSSELGGLLAGLGARDTLRTEMGYPLHGHELSLGISPLQARTGWAVGWDKPEFFGRTALVAEKEAGPARRLYGLKALGRGVPRADLAVLAEPAGTPIGVCTSGTFSPTLKLGIALALLDTSAGVGKGDHVVVDVRGRALECEIVIPPFVDSRT